MEEEDKQMNCERSLGGHMKSNVILNSSGEFETDTNVKNSDDTDQSLAYGLRQNPKKTWRNLGGSNTGGDLYEEKYFCKECGKGFHSLKAICGHMACHSEKHHHRHVENDSSTSPNQISVVDSESDNETGFPRRHRRSRRLRKKSVVIDDYYYSSSVSGAEQEQEELAMCLMMLSRDSSGNWGGVNSFAESSDNNSVAFEAKSMPTDMNFVTQTDQKNVAFGDENVEIENKTRDKKMKFCAFDSNFEQSDSWFLNHHQYIKVETDEAYSSEMEADATFDCKKKAKKRSKYACFICTKTFHSPQALGGHIASHNSKYDSGFASPPPREISDKRVSCNGGKRKGKKHECPVCLKLFKSGQALGGHKRIHGSLDTQEISPRIANVIDLDLNLPPPIED